MWILYKRNYIRTAKMYICIVIKSLNKGNIANMPIFWQLLYLPWLYLILNELQWCPKRSLPFYRIRRFFSGCAKRLLKRKLFLKKKKRNNSMLITCLNIYLWISLRLSAWVRNTYHHIGSKVEKIWTCYQHCIIIF